MSRSGLFDPGLQPERTDLAWRRSALAIGVGALIALRLLPPVLGPPGIAVAVAGFVGAGVIWVTARRRARRTQRALRGLDSWPGGALLLAFTLLSAGAAAVGLLYVLINELG